jgi:hypothetical protein
LKVGGCRTLGKGNLGFSFHVAFLFYFTNIEAPLKSISFPSILPLTRSNGLSPLGKFATLFHGLAHSMLIHTCSSLVLTILVHHTIMPLPCLFAIISMLIFYVVIVPCLSMNPSI